MQMMNNPGNGAPAANQNTAVASSNKAAGDVIRNGGSGPSPADSPVYRAESDNEVTTTYLSRRLASCNVNLPPKAMT